MKINTVKPSALIRFLMPGIWKIKTSQKEVFLSFDDGPIPETTPFVLETLKQYQIKATFFCVGDNVKKYPELVLQILQEGHDIGNHGYSHLKGWNISKEQYIQDVLHCDSFVNSRLFRPPYGKIKFSQARKLKKLGFKIIMWSVLSRDFDKTVSPQQCLDNVKQNVSQGAIIVFHDNKKALENLKYALPRSIEFLLKQGYSFALVKDVLTKKTRLSERR